MNKYLTRKIIASVVIALLMLVSSIKVLDNYADEYTTEAITAAAISYATARGINALVSMMQTTTIEAGVGVSGSISVGELLDPLNDLIERYSSVMVVVLASLAGQKVLLLISSQQFFQVLIMLFGLASIIVVQLNKTSRFGFILKSFLILVFIRFSLGIAVAMNGLVDSSFLIDQTKSYENEIEIFKQDMSSLNSDSGVSVEQIEAYRAALKNLQNDDKLITQKLVSLNNERVEVETGLNQLKDQLDSKQENLSTIGKLFNEDLTVKSLKQGIRSGEQKLGQIMNDIEQQQARLQAISKETVSLDKKIRGEPEGFFERIQKKSNAMMNSFDIQKIEDKVNKNIGNFMNLMAIYILKTIVFPLLFFYMLLLVLKRIWKVEL